MRTSITGLIGAIAVLCLMTAALPAAAQSRATRFSLPEQPLADALRAVGAQTKTSVVFDPDLVDGRRAPALNAEISLNEALRRLLAGTGLTHQFVNEQTVAIRPARNDRKSSSIGMNPVDQMRLASAAGEESGTQRGGDRQQDTPQVVVEGQRERTTPFSTNNLDLTRTEDDVLPFSVFTGKDVLESGAIDLTEFLADRLAQNFADPNESLLEDSDALNDSIDLRGWGSTETVLLLNGRRMAPQNFGILEDGNNTLASLRAIPLGSIERIEVLSSAGSAIYGVGATGGVINIITRRDQRSGQLSVNYQTPMDVMRARRSVDFSFAVPVKFGLGLRMGGGYNETDPMLVGDRAEYTLERYRKLALEREPTRIISVVSGDPSRTSSYVVGATPNVRARNTTYSTAAGSNGAPGNLFASIPDAPRSNFTTGYTRADNDVSRFTPATYNTELAEAGGSTYGRYTEVEAHKTNYSLSFGLDRTVGRVWEWSLDYNYQENESRRTANAERQFTATSANSRNPLIPAAAPFNPFGQDIMVALIDPNLARPELERRPISRTWEVSSTLRGKIGEWRGFIDASFTHNYNHSRTSDFYEPPGGWRAAFLSGVYNPLVDTRVDSPADPQFYDHYIMRSLGASNETRTVRSSVKASGPVFRAPAGRAHLTTGLDWSRANRYRSDYYVEYRDSLTGELTEPLGGFTTGDQLNLDLFGSANSRLSVQTNLGGYAELTVPLLGGSKTHALVQGLEVFASARLNRMKNRGYTSINGSVSLIPALPGLPPPPPPQPMQEAYYERDSHLSAVGLRYEMLEGVTLRASYSAGIKPPTYYQVLPEASTSRQTNLQDPIRKQTFALEPDQYLRGGNPDLKPESTDSTNIGLILQPRWLPGFRLSVDYLESVRHDAISSMSVSETIELEAYLPGRVQRGAPDGDPSGVGPITFVDARQINLREIISRSVDINAEQRIADVGGGRLTLRLAATRNLSFRMQAAATSPAEEQVRNRNAGASRQIAWNGNAQLRWESARLGIGWSARYYDYLLIAPSYFTFQGADRAPAAFNHDLNIRVRLPESGGAGLREWMDGTVVTFGVKNVFDRAPRFWAASSKGIAPYDGAVLPGRTVWMQLRKDFH